MGESPDLAQFSKIAEQAAYSEVRYTATHASGGELVFAKGCLELVGEKAAKLGGTSVLIVTDPGIEKTGHPSRAADEIRRSGLKCAVFDQVRENPTTEDVSRAVEAARSCEADLIVGLGGGSSMDTAKGCNFILTNGGEMKDYWGVGKAQETMLPFIAIPTTSGTGSECQSFALIADAHTHAKMACGDKKSAAAVALLDPALTITQPFAVTAHTGIDAISHAVETAVCNQRTEESLTFSQSAWYLLNEAFESVLTDPEDIVARAKMQFGAALAGNAIEQSMLGIAHSCANPLTASLGTVHGQAVGTMLPHVIRFNRRDEESAKTYQLLCPSLDTRIEELLEAAKMNRTGRELGLQEYQIPSLAKEASGQWTAQFNPVQASEEELAELFRQAL